MSPQNLLPREDNTPTVASTMVYVHEEAKWTYKRVSVDLHQDGLPDEKLLNDLGAKGWELTCMFAHEQSLHFYFKRPGDW